MDVTAPAGTVLDADYYLLDDCRPIFAKDASGGWSWKCLEDEDKTDGAISFLLDMSMDNDLRSAEGVLKVKGLQAVMFDPEEKGNDTVTRLAQASWELPFRMDYQDDPVVYQPRQAVPVERGDFRGDVTVKRVELTPLSARVQLTGSRELLRRVEPATEGAPAQDAILLALRDRQGNPIPVASTGSRTGLTGRTKDETLTFIPAIDPASVAAIVLDGVEIPLEN